MIPTRQGVPETSFDRDMFLTRHRLMRHNFLHSALARVLMFLGLVLTLAALASAQSKFKVLHGFDGGDNGGALGSALTLDKAGNLYGTANAPGHGLLFELTQSAGGGWKEKVLHRFNGNDASGPNGDLIFDSAGNLYGTSVSGGNGYGTIFDLTSGRHGWGLTVLYVFCSQYGCPDGAPPADGVVRDQAGNLYGTTVGGGPYYGGVAFELSPSASGWSYTDLHDFDGDGQTHDGGNPYARLTWDAAGNLYGTTERGGRIGYGTVFELEAGNGWKEKILHSFRGSTGGDGQRPIHDVIFDSSGNLYGTTLDGGHFTCDGAGCGTVFRLTPGPGGQWKETILYEFPNPVDGANPTSRVVFDKAGNIYGTAGGGIGSCGGGCGVVYKLAPQANGKWKYSVLHKFNFSDGGYPGGGLIFDKKGNLYGTASIGGPGGAGVVFEITP
jgi:uncharacterized repeat protein (TIGR03803 family)